MTGKPVVCVAGGPSLTLQQVRLVGMARAMDRCRVIAVNDAAYPCWFADAAIAYDEKWWHLHDGLPGFAGTKLSIEPTGFHDVMTLGHGGIEGADDRRGFIRTGGNSGYGAVHFAAINLQAPRTVLVAYDYGDPDADPGARTHWFGRHGPGMDKHSNTTEWRRLLRGLTDEIERQGGEVVNASARSTISWLPRMSVKHALGLPDEI